MFIFLVVRCPALASWNNLVINTTNTMFLTPVRAACDSDFKFQGSGYVEGSAIHTVCDATGSWNPSVPDCVGKGYVWFGFGLRKHALGKKQDVKQIIMFIREDLRRMSIFSKPGVSQDQFCVLSLL